MKPEETEVYKTEMHVEDKIFLKDQPKPLNPCECNQ